MQTRQAFFSKREKLSCNIKGRVEARLRENEGRGVISGEVALNFVNKKCRLEICICPTAIYIVVVIKKIPSQECAFAEM